MMVMTFFFLESTETSLISFPLRCKIRSDAKRAYRALYGAPRAARRAWRGVAS